MSRTVRGLLGTLPDVAVDGVADGGYENKIFIPLPGLVTVRDAFPQSAGTVLPSMIGPDGLDLPDNAARLETGEPWRVWGSAETTGAGGVRFTAFNGGLAEIGVDLPSASHEVEVTVVVPPTVAAYLIAHHEVGNPAGGYFVLVEYHSDGTLQWIAGDTPQAIATSYVAAAGDRWRLAVDLETNVATFIVDNGTAYDRVIKVHETLDLTLPAHSRVLGKPSWVRVGVAGFDTVGVWGKFTARTLVPLHRLTISARVQRPYLMIAGIGAYSAETLRDTLPTGHVFSLTNNAIPSGLVLMTWTAPGYTDPAPQQAACGYYENISVPCKLAITPTEILAWTAGPQLVALARSSVHDFNDLAPFVWTTNPNAPPQAPGNRYDCYFRDVVATRDNWLYFSSCYPLGSLRVTVIDSTGSYAPVVVPVALDGSASLDLLEKQFPFRALVELRDATGKRYAAAVLRNVYGGDHYKGRS